MTSKRFTQPLNKLLFTVFLVTVLTVTGCSEKDEPNDITGPAATLSGWHEHESFIYSNKILLSAHVSGEMLLMPGWSTFNTITRSGEVEHFSNGGAGDPNYPIRPSDNLHVLVGPMAIKVRPNANPVYNVSGLWVSNSDLVPEFMSWETGLGETGCFNDSDQLLMTAHYLNDSGSYRTGFSLLNLGVESNTSGIDNVVMIGNQFIELPEPNAYLPFRAMTPLGDGFLFSTDGHIWKLSHDGTLDSVHDQSAYSLFVDGDRCYGISDTHRVLQSLDEGSTWQEVGSISHSTVSIEKIGQQTVIYLADRIYQVDFETFEFTELEAENLDGNQITSIVEFEDEVWVTTLSGLFHRSIETFFSEAADQNKAERLILERK